MILNLLKMKRYVRINRIVAVSECGNLYRNVEIAFCMLFPRKIAPICRSTNRYDCPSTNDLSFDELVVLRQIACTCYMSVVIFLSVSQ